MHSPHGPAVASPISFLHFGVVAVSGSSRSAPAAVAHGESVDALLQEEAIERRLVL